MNILRALLVFLLFVAFFLFWWTNAERIDLDLGFIRIEARAATFIVTAFLIGFVPLWLYYRTIRWRLKRRIASLESQNAIPPTKPLDTKKTQIADTDNSPLSSV